MAMERERERFADQIKLRESNIAFMMTCYIRHL